MIPATDSISIGVLPFVNMSGDAEQDYFAEGISEDITIDLSKVGDLSVTAPGLTRIYRTTTSPPSKIAAEIGVDYVLTGSVRRLDKMVRIAVSLVDGRSNRQIWGERYDRRAGQHIRCPDRYRGDVAAAVRSRSPLPAIAQATARGTASLEAHEHYLRGRALLKEMSRRSVDLSKSSFERAIAVDQQYALAYAGLAESITMLGWHYEVAVPLLDQAERILPDSRSGSTPGWPKHTARWVGFIRPICRFDEAEAAFDRAIEISPTLHRGTSLSRPDASDRWPRRRRNRADATRLRTRKQDLHTGMMLMNCQSAVGLTKSAMRPQNGSGASRNGGSG